VSKKELLDLTTKSSTKKLFEITINR
jgi:hypothetical protein